MKAYGRVKILLKAFVTAAVDSGRNQLHDPAALLPVPI
jgi:hypothetical protein